MKRLSVLFMFISVPAMAQDVIVPTNAATFLNIVLGAAAALITGVVVPLAWLYGRQMITERKLKLAQLEEQLRATLDSGAQKAIGGALGSITIPEGKLSGMDKNEVVSKAAKALADNFPDTFAQLKIGDVPAKSKEIIESRIGLMDAQAAGNPVPNPSQAPTVTVPGPTPEIAPVKK